MQTAEAPTPVKNINDQPRMRHRTHPCGVEPLATRCGLPHGGYMPISEQQTTIWCHVCEDLANAVCPRCGQSNSSWKPQKELT